MITYKMSILSLEKWKVKMDEKLMGFLKELGR